jgi:hypothetical protein
VTRIAEILLGAIVLLYAGDFLLVHARADRTRQIVVQQYYAVRLKGKKVEYMPLDDANETCARSLFPQMGYLPCWYVSRHRVRQIDVGD